MDSLSETTSSSSGVSRSGRVRKKSTKFVDFFQSPEEIEPTGSSSSTNNSSSRARRKSDKSDKSDKNATKITEEQQQQLLEETVTPNQVDILHVQSMAVA